MIAFEIGDTVRVRGQDITGEVIDIDYGEGLVTIADSGAETMDDELVYRADELDFVEAEHRKIDDIGRDLKDKR